MNPRSPIKFLNFAMKPILPKILLKNHFFLKKEIDFLGYLMKNLLHDKIRKFDWVYCNFFTLEEKL
jgi:hypothetical protein